MKIRNDHELQIFEETLDRCRASVLVLTPRGEQYDLKDPSERYLGLAEMLRGGEGNEPELYASAREDRVLFLGMLDRLQKESA